MTWAESGWTVTARLSWICCWPLESPLDDWCEPSLLEMRETIDRVHHSLLLRPVTFLVHVQLNGIEHEMRPNERSKLVLGWKRNVYIWHRYDKVDRSTPAVHRQRNGYHPREHDNAMAEMFLEYPHENRDRSRIQSDEWWLRPLLYPEGCFHSFHTKHTHTCRVMRRHWRFDLYLFLLIGAEQSCMMTLLNNDKGDTRLIRRLEADAGFTHSHQFMCQDMSELSFTNAIAIENDSCWFEPCGLVELNK